MSKLDILNCAASGQVVFRFACPVGWAALEETGDPRRRWCPECARSVFRCQDANEAGLRADQGECVAVPDWLVAGLPAETGRIIVGQPEGKAALFARVVAARQAQNQQS